MKFRGLRLVTAEYQLAVVSAAEPAADSSMAGGEAGSSAAATILMPAGRFYVWHLSSSAPPWKAAG